MPSTPPTKRAPPLTCRIIGLGGIGQVVAIYLSLFLNSLNRTARLLLIDGDSYEHANESRMFCGNLGNKAAVMQADLAGRLSPATAVTLLAVPEYVTPDNLDRLIPSGRGESVLLCVDNHATRKLVAEYAGQLDDICLVSGGNDGVGPDAAGTIRQGTEGNVQIYLRRGGVDCSPTLTKYHPEIAHPADARPDEARPDEEGCAELFASGSTPQILFSNLTAAVAMMNSWYWLQTTGELDYSELVFDTRTGRMTPLPLPGVGGPVRATDLVEPGIPARLP